MMARSLMIIVCVVTFVNFLPVNSEDIPRPPTLVDKLILDYFETVKELWGSIENHTENVLESVGKRFNDIRLNGEDMHNLAHKMEEIRQKCYGYDLSLIMTDLLFRSIVERLESASEFNRKTTRIKNYSSSMQNITTLNQFWKAALDTATKSPCSLSPQRMLLKYYYYVQLGYLRCFLVLQQLHMTASVQLTSENVDYKSQAVTLSEEYRAIFSNVRRIAKKYFRLASKDMFTCGPYTYTTVTNFLQGYVDNEANLNSDSSCSSQCSDYKQTRHFQCEVGSLCDTKEGNETKLRCNGIIRDCSEVDSEDVVLCLNKEDSTRRYNGIVKNLKMIAGSSGPCDINADSWRRGFYRCTNCYCLCDDASISERHFSLRDVVSNIGENKIISDIRMNKVNGVIQFQVQEGILLPYASLDKRDDGWLSAPPFVVTDLNVTKDVDFYELSYDKRSINLDEVKLPNGQLLTGIRFCVKNGRLTIEVRGTAFDYVTGTLKHQEESVWISNAKGFNEISMDRNKSTKIDTYFTLEASDVTDAFVMFGPTGFSQDVGQTTIPFIETTAFEPKHLVPIAGVGLYHKSFKYTTSYIAPKLIAYDIEPHILP